LGSVPANKSDSHRPDLVGLRSGYWEIMSPEVTWTDKVDKHGHKGGFRTVKAKCTYCGREHRVALENLLKEKTRGCQSCAGERRKTGIPNWLRRRLDAARQRCQNPNDPGYHHYGGRGIEFRFKTIREAAEYVLQNCAVDKTKEIDRIDNDGHYEPGNLHFVTRRENHMNRRITKTTIPLQDWAKDSSPYSYFTARRKITEGMTKEEVIEDAKLAVREKRKAWRTIQSRLIELGYMTSPMRDHESGLLLAEGSSTTAN
jgi:hypothetical protein